MSGRLGLPYQHPGGFQHPPGPLPPFCNPRPSPQDLLLLSAFPGLRCGPRRFRHRGHENCHLPLSSLRSFSPLAHTFYPAFVATSCLLDSPLVSTTLCTIPSAIASVSPPHLTKANRERNSELRIKSSGVRWTVVIILTRLPSTLLFLNPMGILVATFLDFLAVFHDGGHYALRCSPLCILPFLVIEPLVLSSRIKTAVLRLSCS